MVETSTMHLTEKLCRAVDSGVKLGAREMRAVEVLRAGGYFRTALEWTFRREQFVTRLHDATGAVVAGIGIKTQIALEGARVLRSRRCAPSSVWPSEWTL